MENKNKKIKILFVAFLLVATLFVLSVNVSAICEKTIFYRGQCNPNGALSVHKADGTLIASENAGLFSGCYNNLYFIEIGAGGSSCDWTPGENVLFKINGQDVARVPWVGNDFTVDLNLGNQCAANSDCTQQCPGQNYMLQGICSNTHVCSYTDTCPAITPQCRDGIDNDMDHTRDYPYDPGCETPDDNTETDPSPLPQCWDSVDNDGDGIIDFPFDPGCISASDNSEIDTGVTECIDGLDNDNNGIIDFPWDPGCYAAGDDDESTDPNNKAQCWDQTDNDADSIIDFPFDPGCYAAGDDDEYNNGLTDCSDGIDNDGDGKIDYPLDLECWSAYDDDESMDPECMDERDNDADGKIDYAGKTINATFYQKDPQCTSPFDPTESVPPLPQCSDTIDNDHDNKTDYPNDPGCVNVGDNNETDPSDLPECADGDDNDNDGDIDYPDDDDCESAADDRERDDDNGGGGGGTGGQPGQRRRGGGGGTIGLPSFTGGGYCNICSDWGECKSTGLKYRNCTTVDCDALSINFNSFEIIEEDGELNQTRKGRLVRPGRIGSFLNRNVIRNDLADSYNLTIVNFTAQTEFYDFYGRADQYILQSDRCVYSGPRVDLVQASCYDGIKNQNEEGIDCGGPCLTQCIEQQGIATKDSCWVWWVILAILLVLLAILVYEHYKDEKEILWWVWFAVILLIALDIGLLAACVGYGFSWWMVLIFVVVLLGMLVGYVFFQKKYEDEKLFKNEERNERREKLESGYEKLGMDVPPSVKVGVLPKTENKKTEIISNLSPSTKIDQITNLMKSARDDLKKGDLKKVHQTTDKISAVYKSLPAGKQKDEAYKKFMKLYDDINNKV